MKTFGKIVGGLVVILTLAPILCFAIGFTTAKKRNAAFETVIVGDAQDIVISKMGRPSKIETPDILFSRYADKKCQNPCTQRLWYENRWLLDIEAWSISLDATGKVVEKYHWVSP